MRLGRIPGRGATCAKALENSQGPAWLEGRKQGEQREGRPFAAEPRPPSLICFQLLQDAGPRSSSPFPFPPLHLC